ncbi:KdsC family phosphatase [Microbulbifer thermotolerans]|uniref:3-deoxy-D-manno-octulosonate 8-phosphate phosphatase KdsC n=1 Tax=Microbulbifer thermotolerans TaxID=252514 RepID=A0A143HKJ7_MICTH|nr:HAD family hydrolase [Microbulbifer thermotolerans]AMX02031.1 phenylphosphate carboxylase subunit delta [Microbulbifer thermotolerans]MCX2783101.1 HAD family hydrolase [Microbulbifer thermotolerans]MCX2794297.1 HAD family hydrolase [Microbulbifer thermotolerans]MCX2834256.1 HAD family hydrolase [Microbulbifer thermotolerans]MCX2841527.1 HAD family hydrolase [Microbulbifer thermotolerans]
MTSEKKLTQALKKVRWLVLDVDGVLTDGKLSFDSSGNELKSFNTLDGHGIKMLQKSGVRVAIITGRRSTVVERRAHELGIEKLIQGREDKFSALQELFTDEPCCLENIAYMGDDYPDLLVMTRIGCPISVPNAAPPVRERALWITQARGGEGAVREVCDRIMQAQGTFDAALAPYLGEE